MTKEIRYFKVPFFPADDSSTYILANDLYLTEAGELEVEEGTIWSRAGSNDYLLVFCTRGEGFVLLAGEQVPVKGDQFFIVPNEEAFKYYSVLKKDTRFLIAGFNGKTAIQMSREFSLVRNLVPSVNNLVANREMLFEEIFNNLSKGLNPSTIDYVNLCFGHLLATFIYASRNSDDLADESNPAVRRSLQYMEKHLGKKLTLKQLAAEAGFSATYFTTLFRKETHYAPLSYFSHLKVLKACEYLDYTRMKVKEISYRLGYTDPYYFTRDFKGKMGLSPRQYRNRIRNR
jgi:AraC family transcriptional regulator, arabinose operon regulatory protein